MRVFLLVGLAILWLVGSLISLTLEQTYIGLEVQYDNNGAAIGTTSVLTQLMEPQFEQVSNPVTYVVAIFNVTWDYLKAIWNMLWWNYAMFTGVWSVFKLFGCCISLGVIISLVLAIRGTPNQ